MKIGDASTPAPMQETANRPAPQRSASWLAQLERAWLEGWHGGPAPRSTAQTASEPRQPAGFDASTGEGQRGRGREAALASGAPLPAEDAPSASSHSAGYEQATSALLSSLEPSAAAPTHTGDARVGTPPLESGCTEDVTPRSARSSDTTADSDKASTRAHSAPPHPEASHPPASSRMQVAIANAAAQVTLRDVALSEGQAARTGQAIAGELLGLGLRSVRVYVNGVESHHTAPGDAARAKSSSPSVTSTPQERK